MTKQEFINQIAGYVQKYAPQYGIKCNSAVIAQAILESGWGESKLAAQYHNYFGLKCGTKWTGPSVNMTTQEEYQPGTLTEIKDNFRVYSSMEEGVKGYFEFIQLERYQNLKGIADPQTYLQTIRNDGYATSTTYVENTMALVNQYNLTQYDGKKGNSMTENELRQKPVKWMEQYVGIKKGSSQHKEILAVFNNSRLCTRYTVTVNDAYCATGASAAMIATGLSDIFPCVECSCGNMISLAQKAGIWVENDAHVPNTGDHVFYDWDDNGAGDNAGWPDHVGIVVSVFRNAIRVIECNTNGGTVGYRNISVNGKFIRGFITPKYSSKATSSGGSSTSETTTPNKSITEIAKEVIAGQWGNGDFRKNNLTSAGYDYNAVQSEVNRILSGNGTTDSKKSNAEIAKEVIAGKWGNGDDRKKKLQAAGYDYNAVQAEVNKQLGSSGSAPKKSVDTIAQEVIAGKWGNGDDRKNRLTAAGYDYNAVQKAVNAKLAGSSSGKSVTELAKEVIAGKWGNGADRKNRLTAAGYDYNAVQKKVNELL